MIPYKLLIGETLRAASPVRLFLVDDFTGQPPFGRLNPVLEQKTAAGWQPVPVRPRVGTSGVLVYPNLGLVARPDPGKPLEFRLRLDPEYYRPFYRRHLDDLRFVVVPFNHDTPPRGQVALNVLPPGADPHDYRFLIPGARYPFPAHVTVLYGQVVRPPDSPRRDVVVRGRINPAVPLPQGVTAAVRDIRIRYGMKAIALTDDDGRFALPLKTRENRVLLDLTDERTGTQVTRPVPDGGWQNQTKYLKTPIEFP